MNYQDFPILNNEEYKLLNEKYLQSSHYNRNVVINKICLNLQYCLHSYPNFNNKFNSKILSLLKQSKSTIEKILNNFKEIFNIETQALNSVSNFNLFTFLNKIISTTSLVLTFSNNEEKEYYKTTGIKTCCELLHLTSLFQEALENSTIHFYKHM